MMEKRKYSGRYFMLLGAVALAVWAGYEFMVRAEMLVWFLRGMLRSVVEEHRNFFNEMRYYDPKMFWLTGFLLACFIFALLAICLRNRPNAGYFLIILDLALICAGGPGLHLFDLRSSSPMQWLKLVPLLLIIAGCILNLAVYRVRRGRRHGDWRHHDSVGPHPTNREMARQVRSRRRYPDGD